MQKPPVYRRGCELPPSRDPLPNGCWSVARHAALAFIVIVVLAGLLGCAKREDRYWRDLSQGLGRVLEDDR